MAECVAAVLVDDCCRGAARPRRTPRPSVTSTKRAVALDERPAQPVGVLVELLEGRALGADEPVAEHVLAVAADAGDPGVAVGAGQPDLEPAARLAQRAGAEGRRCGRCARRRHVVPLVGVGTMLPRPAPTSRTTGPVVGRNRQSPAGACAPLRCCAAGPRQRRRHDRAQPAPAVDDRPPGPRAATRRRARGAAPDLRRRRPRVRQDHPAQPLGRDHAARHVGVARHDRGRPHAVGPGPGGHRRAPPLRARPARPTSSPRSAGRGGPTRAPTRPGGPRPTPGGSARPWPRRARGRWSSCSTTSRCSTVRRRVGRLPRRAVPPGLAAAARRAWRRGATPRSPSPGCGARALLAELSAADLAFTAGRDGRGARSGALARGARRRRRRGPPRRRAACGDRGMAGRGAPGQRGAG